MRVPGKSYKGRVVGIAGRACSLIFWAFRVQGEGLPLTSSFEPLTWKLSPSPQRMNFFVRLSDLRAALDPSAVVCLAGFFRK